MNRATSKRMTAVTQKDITSGNAVLQTPPAIFEKLNADFGPFDIDLTGDAERALVYPWFGPDSPLGEFDALTALWSQHGTHGFSNPPYGKFGRLLMAKAMCMSNEWGFESTLLLPMRANASFRDYVVGGASELLFCDERIAFWENGAPRINPKSGKADAAMFDSIIVRYVPGQTTLKVGIWEVPPHG